MWGNGIGAIVGALALLAATLGAWLTHIIVAINALVSDAAVSVGYGFLLVAGAIIPPVGMIHGWGVWIGAW